MSSLAWKMVLLVVIVGLVAACAQPTPTAAPTKPPAPPTTAPAAATAAPKAAPTVAPTAAPTKPAAPTATPAPKVKRGGTLVFAKTTSYADMDPHKSIGTGAVTTMLYETLIDYDLVDAKTGKFDLAPSLAESWKVVDPKTIEFKLRKGVKFHDGSEWNAEVAKWNLDRVRTNAKSAGKHLVSEIESVQVVDPTTINLKLKAPWVTLFVNLTGATGGTGGHAALMVSKAAVDKGGDDVLSNQPVGTGPMVIDRWTRDDRVTMKKWDGYWKSGVDGKPLPYLDGFVDRVIPDPSVTLVEMKAGSVQLTEDIEAKDVAGIKANPELVFYEMPWSQTTNFIFGFNQAAPIFKNNRKLAQAIQHALDREGMAKVLGFGLATPAYYYFWTASLLGHNEDIPKYKFDLAKSKQLLAEVGYPTGLDMDLLVQSRQPNPRQAEVAKQMWDTAGIRTTLEVMERLAAHAKAKAGNFQIYFWRQSSSPDPDLQTRVVGCDAPSNWSNYCNPELDKCMAEGRASYDSSQRQKIYERCLRLIQEDAMVGAGYFLPDNKVMHKSVKGLKVHWAQLDVREVWLDK